MCRGRLTRPLQWRDRLRPVERGKASLCDARHLQLQPSQGPPTVRTGSKNALSASAAAAATGATASACASNGSARAATSAGSTSGWKTSANVASAERECTTNQPRKHKIVRCHRCGRVLSHGDTHSLRRSALLRALPRANSGGRGSSSGGEGAGDTQRWVVIQGLMTRTTAKVMCVPAVHIQHSLSTHLS